MAIHLENYLDIGKELIIQVNNKEQKVTILKKRILENETLSSNDDLKNFWIERLFFISTLINLLNYLETAGYIISHSFLMRMMTNTILVMMS